GRAHSASVRRPWACRALDPGPPAARSPRQADDETRRGACDVIIDNSGPVEQTRDTVGELITDRLRPFAENLTQHRRAPLPRLELIDPADRDWAGEAERVIAKLSYGTDARFPVEHIGSTSVPGLPAKDVL